MARRKQRVRSPHPGVVLLDGDDRRGPRARWKDPRTKRRHEQSMLGLDVPDRVEWAKRKALEIMAMRAAVSGRTGAARVDASIDVLVKGYLIDLGTARVREKTLLLYTASAKHFTDWCVSTGIANGRDLTGDRLAGLRSYIATLPSRRAKADGTRGEQADRGQRSLHTINKDLRAIAAMLAHLRQQLHLTRDDIADGLKRYRAPQEAPDFLRPAEIRQLLRSAIKYDTTTFALTRDGRTDTPRYEAIAPFTLCLLLSGMRRSEALELQWSDVDSEAGEIHLPASKVKTGKARSIDLAVSPGLVALLAALRPSKYRRDARVFPDLTEGVIVAARKRLVKRFKAPLFEWHGLRRTAGTFLTCSPSIYSAASVFLSAQQLGHSVDVAQRSYLGRVKVAPEHKTLEAAMGIASIVPLVVLRALLRKTDRSVAAAEVEAKQIVADALERFGKRR